MSPSQWPRNNEASEGTLFQLKSCWAVGGRAGGAGPIAGAHLLRAVEVMQAQAGAHCGTCRCRAGVAEEQITRRCVQEVKRVPGPGFQPVPARVPAMTPRKAPGGPGWARHGGLVSQGPSPSLALESFAQQCFQPPTAVPRLAGALSLGFGLGSEASLDGTQSFCYISVRTRGNFFLAP